MNDTMEVRYARAAHKPERYIRGAFNRPLDEGLTPEVAWMESLGGFLKTWECMTGHKATHGLLCPTCQRQYIYIREKIMAGEAYVPNKVPTVGLD